MIRSVIIDDEKGAREDIRERIRNQFEHDVEIIAEADSVETGKQIIDSYKPNLVFLDIQLSDGTGFDIITQAHYKDYNSIFITGYDAHAIQAIKVGALDYILKPIDNAEFNDAVLKAIKSSHEEQYMQKLAEVSLEFFKGTNKKRIVLKSNDNVHVVYEDDIFYCQADGNYTLFYTQGSGRIMVSKTMKHMESILSREVFIRCHHSFLVNKKHVIRYDKDGILVLRMDMEVPVSLRRKEYTLGRLMA